MVNRYSHAIVLSYYESRGWITLPPSFQSSFLLQPHSSQSPPPPPRSSHDREPISSLRYHRPAAINQRGRQPGPVAGPSTPRSTTPPSRAQAPTTSIASTPTTTTTTTTTTWLPPKSTWPGRSPQRPTPSIITEIFVPEHTSASATCQHAQSPPAEALPNLPSPSSEQRISALTNYDCPSPTSTIFNLLGPMSSLQDDRDYTPPLTNSGSSVSSSFRLEPVTPFLSESPTDSHDSPILKPFDDFVPTFDDLSQYATETGSPWHDPASPTAPTIFSLPTVDLSIHPALRGRLAPPPPPPPFPPPVVEDEGEDDAIPPPIARHRRPGPAKLTKVDRSAMSFLKQQPAVAPLSSNSKRSGGDYSYALGIADPPAIPLNLGSHFSSLRQAPPPPSRSRDRQEQQQMKIAVATPPAGSDLVGQPQVSGSHHSGLTDWIKGNRSKR